MIPYVIGLSILAIAASVLILTDNAIADGIKNNMWDDDKEFKKNLQIMIQQETLTKDISDQPFDEIVVHK